MQEEKRFYKHNKSGDSYRFLNWGKVKIDDVWCASVNYCDLKEKVFYTRTHDDFFTKFTEI